MKTITYPIFSVVALYYKQKQTAILLAFLNYSCSTLKIPHKKVTLNKFVYGRLGAIFFDFFKKK